MLGGLFGWGVFIPGNRYKLRLRDGMGLEGCGSACSCEDLHMDLAYGSMWDSDFVSSSRFTLLGVMLEHTCFRGNTLVLRGLEIPF